MTDDISQSVCVSNKNCVLCGNCIQNYSHDVAFYCKIKGAIGAGFSTLCLNFCQLPSW